VDTCQAVQGVASGLEKEVESGHMRVDILGSLRDKEVYSYKALGI